MSDANQSPPFVEERGETRERCSHQSNQFQETDAEIHETAFLWTIKKFSCVRDHAAMGALSHMQNFVESKIFGSEKAGQWYLMLFPHGEASKDNGGLMIRLVSNNRQSLTAQAHFVILDDAGDPSENVLPTSLTHAHSRRLLNISN
eukprot:GHVN01008547.1.p1 GENE.GHVN01008547.1~~GHVN01008547.1.p1  ORF type:complete len:146 (+),score=22.29 GHVN01008547.1:38-475(+)